MTSLSSGRGSGLHVDAADVVTMLTYVVSVAQ